MFKFVLFCIILIYLLNNLKDGLIEDYVDNSSEIYSPHYH